MSVSPSSPSQQQRRAEGKGFEPSSPLWWRALAVRPGKPYPATFRTSGDRPGIEPGFPPRQGGVSNHDSHHGSGSQVEALGPGIAPDLRASKAHAATHACAESAHRESNPHIRHGKATGCRYIMALHWLPSCQRSKSTGRKSNPRCRITSAESCRWTTSACCPWGRRDLNPHPPG